MSKKNSSQKRLSSVRSMLMNARKQYSKCASRVEHQIQTQGLNQVLSDRVIGIGIAASWLRRASEMDRIQYVGKHLNQSEHCDRFTDFVRFGFVWFSLNAIYDRESILSLLANVSKGYNEFEKFELLFKVGLISSQAVIEDELRSLLDTNIATRTVGGLQKPVPITTLSSIYSKYIPSGTVRGKAGKALFDAANKGCSSNVDLPIMLYGFRNWSLHGNAIDGCFGSHVAFTRYQEILTTVLAQVHLNVSSELLRKL